MSPENLMLIAAPLRGKFEQLYLCQVGLSALLVDVSIGVSRRCTQSTQLRKITLVQSISQENNIQRGMDINERESSDAVTETSMM